ncbi:MAG: NusG domain II-containing protein [Clostridia bacterium]|nr:NusG domain II-containing protein [Clostridia bacterium]
MKERNGISKVHLRNDVVMIILLLVLAGAGALYLFAFRGSGDTVNVTVDGELYGVYALSEPRVEEIRTGEDGSRLNRLVIRDGKAYVESASCPDGICAAHRPVFRRGESIVCLPHRVVITVVTEQRADSPDIVA